MIAQIIATQHSDSLYAIELVYCLNYLQIAWTAIICKWVIYRNKFTSIELVLSFVVKLLNNVSELFTKRSNSRSCGHHWGERLWRSKGKNKTDFGLKISCGLFWLWQRIDHFGITSYSDWVSCWYKSLEEWVFYMSPKDWRFFFRH